MGLVSVSSSEWDVDGSLVVEAGVEVESSTLGRDTLAPPALFSNFTTRGWLSSTVGGWTPLAVSTVSASLSASTFTRVG